MDEVDVIQQAVLKGEVAGYDRDLGNDDEPLDPRVARVEARADGKIDAEQDEGDKHPLLGEDLPEDGEGRKEAGKVSGSADEGRDHVHDAEQEPGIPVERPGQHHPVAEKKAERRKEKNQHYVDEPAGERWRNPSPRVQLDLRCMYLPCLIAVEDGNESVPGGHETSGESARPCR